MKWTVPENLCDAHPDAVARANRKLAELRQQLGEDSRVWIDGCGHYIILTWDTSAALMEAYFNGPDPGIDRIFKARNWEAM